MTHARQEAATAQSSEPRSLEGLALLDEHPPKSVHRAGTSKSAWTAQTQPCHTDRLERQSPGKAVGGSRVAASRGDMRFPGPPVALSRASAPDDQ